MRHPYFSDHRREQHEAGLAEKIEAARRHLARSKREIKGKILTTTNSGCATPS